MKIKLLSRTSERNCTLRGVIKFRNGPLQPIYNILQPIYNILKWWWKIGPSRGLGSPKNFSVLLYIFLRGEESVPRLLEALLLRRSKMKQHKYCYGKRNSLKTRIILCQHCNARKQSRDIRRNVLLELFKDCKNLKMVNTFNNYKRNRIK